jgi:hypothetical protein
MTSHSGESFPFAIHMTIYVALLVAFRTLRGSVHPLQLAQVPVLARLLVRLTKKHDAPDRICSSRLR